MTKDDSSNEDELLTELFRIYVDEPMRTPEARAYEKAQTLDDLCFEAGRYVAAHAFTMAKRLGLGWHGRLPIAAYKVVAPKRWRSYVADRLEAFAACVVADLFALNDLLARRSTSPAVWSRTLQRLVAMACVHAARTLQLDDGEKRILLNAATLQSSTLLDHTDLSHGDVVHQLLHLPAVRARSLSARQATAFLASTMLEGTALNATAFRRHHERLSGSSHTDGTRPTH